jgi:uncharacterized 2Fe-2S/4Fe-4S cluster protein (DUF4445 family)
MKHSITFLPHNLTTHAPEGITLFNAANWAGLAIDSTCGGRGTCGKCKVRVLRGADRHSDADSQFLSKAEIDAGWRLSCRTLVSSACEIEVPRLMTAPKAALLGYGRHVAIAPNVVKILVNLLPPTLEDQRSDLARLLEALKLAGYVVQAGLDVWRALPKILRANDFAVTAVVCGNELIAVEPGNTTSSCYGLALDVGTTTVVGALIDLHSGAVAAVESDLNRQARFGADVIARISHSMLEEDGLAALCSSVNATINQLIEELLMIADVTRCHVYEALVVGNATMLHLLLGLDPEAIGVEPFISTINEPVTVPAVDVGLNLGQHARLSTLPHLGAYVGSDIVAGILATGLARNPDGRVRLYIDVGTNGEIVLGSKQRTLATAAPAGPAFEGAQIRCGMRASAGAIEGVKISNDVELQVIGGTTPLVDKSGRLATREEVHGQIPSSLAERLVVLDGGMRAFLIGDQQNQIMLTQADIRALQFAKAAIAAGVQVLMSHLGLVADDMHEVLLAGSFGSYINPASARTIGLVPWVAVERIVAVGNGAGEGAKIALLSFREREAAGTLPSFIEYLELSGRPEFNDIFTDALAFPTQPPGSAR